MLLNPEEFAEYIAWAADPGEPFKPSVSYNPDGDQIEVFVKPSSFYGEWISDELTIYRDRETDDVVGCVINGIRTLTQEVDDA